MVQRSIEKSSPSFSMTGNTPRCLPMVRGVPPAAMQQVSRHTLSIRTARLLTPATLKEHRSPGDGPHRPAARSSRSMLGGRKAGSEGLDVLTANAKLECADRKRFGVIPQVAVVPGVCGGTSALSAANADVCIASRGELFFIAPATSAKGDKRLMPAVLPLPKAGVASIAAGRRRGCEGTHIVVCCPQQPDRPCDL